MSAVLRVHDGEEAYRRGVGCYLSGQDSDAHLHLGRAHQAFQSGGDAPRAARSAFWLAMIHLHAGESAQGAGWLARGARVIDGHPDCVEHGYLRIPQALAAVAAGDFTGAAVRFGQVVKAGERFDDRDLLALGRLGLGQTRVGSGDVDGGMVLLDEVMVSVQSGEISAIPAGIIYCAVIEVCRSVYDLRRAREWTAALSNWCAAQPDLVPFRGQCLVHRAEILQLNGSWHEALGEAQSACDLLSTPNPPPVLGAARYQLAELHRLRGELDEAEAAYRAASKEGCAPQPGLALLRLAQGRTDAALAAIRRALDEDPDRPLRVKLLAAHAEIALAADDVPAARAAADELSALADDLDVPPLRAVAAHVDGGVQIVEGDPRGALSSLRAALVVWQELDAPYEAGRVQVLLGLACRALGDRDGADLELDAAREVFHRLGAEPELHRLEQLAGGPHQLPAGLTERELEVLRLIAKGKSNRDVAGVLVISQHTVARHLQNVYAKLGINTRTAAVAFVLEHDLAEGHGRF